jgi:holdfast attachment protein HfaA
MAVKSALLDLKGGLARRLQPEAADASKRSDDMEQATLNEAEIACDRGRIARLAFGVAGIALVSAAVLAAAPAAAQSRAGYANEFSRPYGMNPGDESRPYDARTRDLNGNRVIVDGRIVVGDDLSSLPLGLYNSGNGLGLSGYAIGNQLNVTTQGSFNTVIVNSTQINNGDQTVIINGTGSGHQSSCHTAPTGCATSTSNNAQQVLNGGLDF